MRMDENIAIGRRYTECQAKYPFELPRCVIIKYFIRHEK